MPRLLAVTLANSYGFVSPQELADEKFLYGSANGVVYSWKLRKQRAKPHNLNSRSSIETVLLASDGRWFVGGSWSLLKASGDEGQTWHSARDSLPFGVITDLREWIIHSSLPPC